MRPRPSLRGATCQASRLIGNAQTFVDVDNIGLDDTRDLLAGWAPQGAAPEEMAEYARYSAGRLLAAARSLVGLPQRARVLEIGANPYFLTVLMRQVRPGLDWICTNFDPALEEAGRFEAVVEHTGSGESFAVSWHQVNVETQELPFEDAGFDAVVYCEVLEHLYQDPAASLTRIHRVLAPGAALPLTTPNPASAPNVVRLLRRQSVGDPISGHGIYGRHRREYAACELAELLDRSGFEVLSASTVETSNARVARRVLARLG